MKNLLTAAASLSLLLAVGNAAADDAQPLLTDVTSFTALSDTELADVKGNYASYCFICALGNNAYVTQLNYSGGSALVSQGNTSGVIQSNN